MLIHKQYMVGPSITSSVAVKVFLTLAIIIHALEGPTLHGQFSAILLSDVSKPVSDVAESNQRRNRKNNEHCKNGMVNMTYSLSFWLQMSEPITHMDIDNYMTIHYRSKLL